MLRCCIVLILFARASVGLAGERTLLVLGDSLSAAYGMPMQQGWVSQLGQRLERQGYKYAIINASISGETTQGALVRLPAILAAHKVDIAIVELGGNDGLRGIPLAEIELNLGRIIEALRVHDAEVALVQMQLPPNYGPAYAERFTAMYGRLAAAHAVHLTRFALERLVNTPGMMQADRLHPTAEAQAIMLDAVWEDIKPLLHRSAE